MVRYEKNRVHIMDVPKGHDGRISDAKEWYRRNGIDKEKWCELTGFSESQWYRWHAGGSMPKASQMVKIIYATDMNVLKLWFGIGPDKLSDLEAMLAESSTAAAQISEIHAMLKREGRL